MTIKNATNARLVVNGCDLASGREKNFGATNIYVTAKGGACQILKEDGKIVFHNYGSIQAREDTKKDQRGEKNIVVERG